MPRKTIDITPINQKKNLVSGEIGVINSPLIADDAGHPVSGKPKMVSPSPIGIGYCDGFRHWFYRFKKLMSLAAGFSYVQTKTTETSHIWGQKPAV